MHSKKAMAPEYAVGLIFAALLILMTIFLGDLLAETFGDAKDQDAISNFGSLAFDIERVVNDGQEFTIIESFVKIPQNSRIIAFSSLDDSVSYSSENFETRIVEGPTQDPTKVTIQSSQIKRPSKCQNRACVCLYKTISLEPIDCTLFPQKIEFSSSVGLGNEISTVKIAERAKQAKTPSVIYKDVVLHGTGHLKVANPISDFYIEKLKIDDTISIFISDLKTGVLRKDAFLTQLDPTYFPDPQNAINNALKNIKSDLAGTYDELEKLVKNDKAPDKVKAIALLEQGKLAIDTTIRDYTDAQEKFKEIISKYTGELTFDGSNIAHQAHFHLQEIAFIPQFSQSRAPEFKENILQSSNLKDLESANNFFNKGIQFFEDPTKNKQPLLLTLKNIKRGQEHLVYLKDIKDKVNVRRGLVIYGFGAEHLSLKKDASKAEVITAIGNIPSLEVLEDENDEKILFDLFNDAEKAFSIVKNDEEIIMSFQSADEWQKDIAQIIGAIQLKDEELNK